MIPKIIHYCWFGGKEYPELVVHCINSWKKYCPDFKMMRWDETNTNLEENEYIKEAYKAKKWAFVSDYVRLNALYKYGGIYMDTDIELIKSLDDFIDFEAFSGFENDSHILTGIIGSTCKHPFIFDMLSYYRNRHFIKDDGTYDVTTNVQIITDIAIKKGLLPNNTFQIIDGIHFYPRDYFSPKDHSTGMVHLTDNTICIHHFDGSWHTCEEKKLIKIERVYIRLFGKKVGGFLFRIHKNIMYPKYIKQKIYRFTHHTMNK